MRIRTLVGALAATALLLTGCGDSGDGGSAASDDSPESSGSSDTSGSAADGDEGFDPASAKLPAGLFCDQVDTGLVAELLGVPQGKVRLTKQTKVGQEISGGPGIPPMPAQTNSCEYGKDSGFVVGIGPNTPEGLQQARVKEALEREKEKPPKNAVLWTRCSTEETEAVGADGFVETCDLVGSSDSRRTATISGMAGTDRFVCFMTMSGKGPKAAALAQPLTDTCASIMADVATG